MTGSWCVIGSGLEFEQIRRVMGPGRFQDPSRLCVRHGLALMAFRPVRTASAWSHIRFRSMFDFPSIHFDRMPDVGIEDLTLPDPVPSEDFRNRQQRICNNPYLGA